VEPEAKDLTAAMLATATPNTVALVAVEWEPSVQTAEAQTQTEALAFPTSGILIAVVVEEVQEDQLLVAVAPVVVVLVEIQHPSTAP
jgi:hypothetical protein